MFILPLTKGVQEEILILPDTFNTLLQWLPLCALSSGSSSASFNTLHGFHIQPSEMSINLYKAFSTCTFQWIYSTVQFIPKLDRLSCSLTNLEAMLILAHEAEHCPQRNNGVSRSCLLGSDFK